MKYVVMVLRIIGYVSLIFAVFILILFVFTMGWISDPAKLLNISLLGLVKFILFVFFPPTFCLGLVKLWEYEQSQKKYRYLKKNKNIESVESDFSRIAEYAEIPISFRVKTKYKVSRVDEGLGGFKLIEKPLKEPYVKDYDQEESPLDWSKRFDVSNWTLLFAQDGDEILGGAVVAFNTEGVHMLDGRKDMAVLWDIRIKPEFRGRGIGSMLLSKAEEWAVNQGCNLMKIETQNVNISACKFYRREGYHLGCVHQYAYPDFPEEIMFLWYKELRQ